MIKLLRAILEAAFIFIFLIIASKVSWGAGAEARPGKGGAELWSENCARCHNILSPSTHSDKEWQIIAHHMRVRANLTEEEHQKILEFLKSAN